MTVSFIDDNYTNILFTKKAVLYPIILCYSIVWLVSYELNPDIFWQKIYFERDTVGMSNPTDASHADPCRAFAKRNDTMKSMKNMKREFSLKFQYS